MNNYIFFYKRLIKAGGAERLLVKTYNEFVELGKSVKIVTFEFNSDNDFLNNKFKKEDIVEIKGNVISRIISLRRYLSNNNSKNLIHSGYIDFGLSVLFNKKKYSILIHHPSAMSFNETDKYSFLKKRTLKKLILNNPGKDMILSRLNKATIYDRIFFTFRSIISSYIIRNAKAVFVLSKFAVKEKKIMYNINAICNQGALDHRVKYFTNSRKNNNQKKFSLLSVARLDKNKRFDKLIKAFSKIDFSRFDCSLTIAGTGEEYDYLVDYSKELGVDSRVVFLGYVTDEDLFNLYNNSHLFISIDWADFRITQFESMSCKCPVLVSDETDIDSEFDKTGYYFTVNPNSKDINKKIEEILSNNNKDDILLENLLSELSWSKYSKRLIDSI